MNSFATQFWFNDELLFHMDRSTSNKTAQHRPSSPDPILSSSAFPSLENLPTGQHYKPVAPHWFFRQSAAEPQQQAQRNQRRESSILANSLRTNEWELDALLSPSTSQGSACPATAVWQPFSAHDSSLIESRYALYLKNPTTARSLVHTDGGRYDVDLCSMKRRPVYWSDPEDTCCQVRRCTWFFINATDETYVPYNGDVAEKLEHEYRKGIASDEWNRRIELVASKDFFIMYDANHIVHTMPSAKRDEWGSVFDGRVITHIVKRGVEDYKKISQDSPIPIDHVIFVIHGIGEFCDFKFRTITQCVDGMRDICDKLLKSHFKESISKGLIGRVELIPCNWHKILHSESTGVDSRLQSITLSSIRKLREYTNDTLVDILFYTSPIYCQTIIDTVSNELNRLYALFIERNSNYKGTFSLIGHSLGSLIAFDLLSHQNDSNELEKRNAADNPYETSEDGGGKHSALRRLLTPTQFDMDDLSSTISSRTFDSSEDKASFVVGDDGQDSSSDGKTRTRPAKRFTRLAKPLLTAKTRALSATPPKGISMKDIKSRGVYGIESQFDGTSGFLKLLTLLGVPPEAQQILTSEHMDLEALLLCDEKDLKDMGITTGPRKKIMKYLSSHPRYTRVAKSFGRRKIFRSSNSFSDLSTLSPPGTDSERGGEPGQISVPRPDYSRRRSLVTLDEMTNQEEAPTSTFGFTVGTAGTGQPYVSYQKLRFEPTCFFAMGSPIGLFLTIRGIELIGDDYMLPTCPHFFNIFHPLDPVAFRLEPLVNPCLKLPPVQIAHHKGRKRIHLELQENLNKMSFDLRQGLFQTFKSTMNSLQGISFAKTPDSAISQNPYLRGGLDASKSVAQLGTNVENEPKNGLSKPSLISRMLRSASIQYSSKLEGLKGDLWQSGGSSESLDQFSAKTSRPSLQISDTSLLNDLPHRSKGILRPRLVKQVSETLSPGSQYESVSEPSSNNSPKEHWQTNDDNVNCPGQLDSNDKAKGLKQFPSSTSLYGGNPSQEVANIERYIQTVSENAMRMNKNITFSAFSTPLCASNLDTITESTAPSSDQIPTNMSMGRLNSGYRIDYMLQEKPIEAFNEYIFALHSHVCYWESEDTMLLILNQLYALQGITGSMHSSLLEEFTSFMPSLFHKKI